MLSWFRKGKLLLVLIPITAKNHVALKKEVSQSAPALGGKARAALGRNERQFSSLRRNR
jgi:hypothetical protein